MATSFDATTNPTPSGSFNVTDQNPGQTDQSPSGPAALPVPGAAGIQEPMFKPQTVVNSSGGSSSSGIAGGLFGGIGKAIGGIFGDLFSKGGVVHSGNVQVNEAAQGGLMHKDRREAYAEGGQVPQDDPLERALATGYLVGALHQGKYGGTHNTLIPAAKEIRTRLAGGGPLPMMPASPITAAKNSYDISKEKNDYTGGPNQFEYNISQRLRDELKQKGLKGFAAGGTTMPQKTSTSGGANAVSSSTVSPAVVPNYSYDDLMSYFGANNEGPYESSTVENGNSIAPQSAAGSSMPTSNPTTGNYISSTRGYASGGPDIPPQAGQNQPPLAPGQQFQGDGSVKGPGGPQDDAIPAKLSNGEFVMSAPATQFFGVDKLNKMNEQGKQGFMQAVQQVQQNQQPQGPNGQPVAAPKPMALAQGPGTAQPPQQPSQGAKTGGVIRAKGRGYMGL